MAQFILYTKDGKKSGSLELSPEIFEKKVSKRLMEQVNHLFSYNRRTGNAHTKTRAEVRGGGARPWRQKGTGRARVSSIRSPLWRGGGTVFGPRKRDIYSSIPKKMRDKALIGALSKRCKETNIFILDELAAANAKTRELAAILAKLGLDKRSVLCVINKENKNILQAAKNIKKVTVKSVTDCNAYHVLRKSALLLDKQTAKALEERLLKTK